MREVEIEKYLVRRVKEKKGLAPKWVAPGHRGVPDRIVILPNGKVVFVELKAQHKKLSPLQLKWASTLKKMNQTCYVLDSKVDVDRFIRVVFENGIQTP